MKKLLTELVVDQGAELRIPDMRIGETARNMLHEAAEEHIVQYFQKAVLNMAHAGRVTLKVKDFKLIDNQHFLDDGTMRAYKANVGMKTINSELQYRPPPLAEGTGAASSAPGAAGPSGAAA